MLDIFFKIYDVLFPPHQSVKQLKVETREKFVRHFSPHRVVNCIALSSYAEPAVRAAITANKFHDYDKAAVLLSSLVEHWLSTMPPLPTTFVPIPLSTTRQKSRGYNQVRRVLEKTQADLVIADILSRGKETKPQTSLNREERFKNVAEAFIYRENEFSFSKQRVVIVDDVVTTGATMFAAQSTLSLHLPDDCEVVYLALAH